MSYWGKVIGGMAGFAMAGPFGAAIGAALGHAADSGMAPRFPSFPFGPFASVGDPVAGQAKIAAMLGQKQQLFSIAVVALSAKLAKCDGPVKRAEIDAFRRQFRVQDSNVRDIGQLFDLARETTDDFETYAGQLGDPPPLAGTIAGWLVDNARLDLLREVIRRERLTAHGARSVGRVDHLQEPVVDRLHLALGASAPQSACADLADDRVRTRVDHRELALVDAVPRDPLEIAEKVDQRPPRLLVAPHDAREPCRLPESVGLPRLLGGHRQPLARFFGASLIPSWRATFSLGIIVSGCSRS